MAGAAITQAEEKEITRAEAELVTTLISIIRNLKVAPGTTQARLTAHDRVENTLQESLTREAPAGRR